MYEPIKKYKEVFFTGIREYIFVQTYFELMTAEIAGERDSIKQIKDYEDKEALECKKLGWENPVKAYIDQEALTCEVNNRLIIYFPSTKTLLLDYRKNPSILTASRWITTFGEFAETISASYE